MTTPKHDDDELIEDNNIKLLVNKKSFLYLVGTTLEFSDGLNGKGFVFNNPNLSRTWLWRKFFSLIFFTMSDIKKQTEDELLEEVTSSEYKYGFTTDIESDTIPKGLSEEVVRTISAKKNEPEWMLEYRLNAYRAWLEMEEPDWANVSYEKPNYQDVIYYLLQNKNLY